MLLLKEAFDKYNSLVDVKYLQENFRELNYLYICLNELREQFSDKDFSVDELQSFFQARYPDANADLYEGLFKDLRSVDVSAEVGSHVLAQIKRRKALLRLSERAYAATQGLAEFSEVQQLVQDLETAPSEVAADIPYVSTDLEELINAVVKQRGIRFRLNCLNKALGSLRKGDFGFVFARPETGKTTFIADVASSALDQVTSPVVWFNNEEEGRKVMLRVYQSYFGVTLDTLLANIRLYKERFRDRVGGKFLLVDSAQTDRSTVERVLQSVKPSLIIYDQLPKIQVFKADRDDLVHGMRCQWARELAKEYAPSVGVFQADGTAEGMKWLDMNHVSKVKTDAQAEADWILGIGKTHDTAGEYVRYFNISKNKLLGDEDSMPELRHGRFEVLIQPEIARYKDIVNYE
jgi:hypothetical protein